MGVNEKFKVTIGGHDEHYTFRLLRQDQMVWDYYTDNGALTIISDGGRKTTFHPASCGPIDIFPMSTDQ